MNKPRFKDECKHGLGNYIGTVEITKRCKEDYEYYDVYAFRTGYSESEICVRYGNDEDEYLSPGSLIMLATISKKNKVYEEVLKLIDKTCLVKIERR